MTDTKKFVVLESKRPTRNRHYARIHRASCGHAKKPDYKTVSTLCHGYFERYYEALDFAKSLNVEVYDCVFCSPRSKRGKGWFSRHAHNL